ncbi:MAG: EpsI family protein [Proteobacteria bacterium]|nr:EpsI family protein [Pseudomonadota bacterium]MBU1736867.1 EpsI family protein [Pseudomonadota bacterium]
MKSQVPVEKKNLVEMLFPGLIFLSFAVGCWSSIEKLLVRWNTGDDDYCFLVLPLFVYLCWEKKDHFRFNEFSWWPPAVIPALTAALFIFIGELGSVETLLYVGLWMGMVSVVALLYGKRIGNLVFPLVILSFIVPLPPYINKMLTFNLKMISSSLSVNLLRLTGTSVFQDGNIIDLGVQQLQVVDACSGLRYVMPMFLMSLLIGHFFVSGWWRRAIIVALVLPISVGINSIRILVTGVLIVNGHAELAENFFHDFTGLLIFLSGGIGLFFCALLLKKIGSEQKVVPTADKGGRNRSLSLKSALTAIFLLIFLGSGFMLQRVPHLLTSPERKMFDDFPMVVGEWEGERRYLSKEIMNELWADDYINGVFTRKKDPRQKIYLLIPYYRYQGTRHTAHAPQSCLLGGGWSMVDSGNVGVKVTDDQMITIRTMTLKKDDYNMLGSYFFLSGGKIITSPWLHKVHLIWSAMTRSRTDGALVRVEVVGAEDLNESRDALDGFLVSLWPLLAEYVPD